MMATRSPVLTIDMSPEGLGVRVELHGRGQPLSWVVQDRDELMSARQGLSDDLFEFKRLVGNQVEVSAWKKVDEAMHLLHEKGRWLASLFTDGSRSLAGSVQEYVRRSCPTWMAYAEPPILIEVKSHISVVFPVDLLPLFDRTPPTRITGPRDLWCAARSFLGLAAVLKRTLSGIPMKQDDILRNDRGLPVKLLYDAGLSGARKEAEFFSGAPYFAFERAWPSEPVHQHDLRRRLTAFLVDPTEGIDRRLDVPDQILHFACHCDTEWEFPGRYSIRLSSGVGGNLTITMAELGADLNGAPASDENVSLPLVVMNACGTGKIVAGAVSYPKLFLTNGNRGFVGTETRIPNAFAAAFSRRFYRNLMQGLTLGDAIYDSKLHFLTKRNNPLGILYATYADTDMRVQRPLTKEELGE